MKRIRIMKRLGSTVVQISKDGGNTWEPTPDEENVDYEVVDYHKWDANDYGKEPKLKSTFPSGDNLGHTQTGRIYEKNGLLTPGFLPHRSNPYDKLEQVVVDINDKEAIKKAEVDITSGRGNYYVPSNSDWDVDDNRSKHIEPLPRVVKMDLKPEDQNEITIGDWTHVFEMGVEVGSYRIK